MFVDVKLMLYRPIVPKLICLVLGLFVVWEVSTGILSFFSLNKSMVAPLTHVKETNVEVKQDSLRAVLTTAFFGDYVPNNLNVGDVKQSMLNLKVVGIMFANKEDDSNVIIRAASDREITYRVGDNLPGGAVIKRITPKFVLILRNGALERLNLSTKELTFEPPARPLSMHPK